MDKGDDILPRGDQMLDKTSNFANLLDENHLYRKMLPTDDDGGEK